MQAEQFQKLGFGNVVMDGGKKKFIVSSVVRDPETNQIKHIGLTPAIGQESACNFEVVDTTTIVTSLVGKSTAGI